MATQPIDPLAYLQRLLGAQIEFIVVGGGAAILHGASTFTADFDIVHRRSPENIDRLLALLEELGAVFRNDLGNRRLKPNRGHLTGRGQVLLSTSLGPLDLLCVLHDQRGYDELLPHSVIKTVERRDVRVLDLDTLIEVKTAAGRTKDKLAVSELLKIRESK